MTTTATKLTLADINRTKIAEATGTDLAWVSRIFNPKLPNWTGSLGLARQIAEYLGVSMEEFVTFLREECGKDI